MLINWFYREQMIRISVFSLEMSSMKMFPFQKTGLTLHLHSILPGQIMDSLIRNGAGMISEDRFRCG